MTTNETFNDAYFATGRNVLHLIDRVREKAIDYPADSSTGAKWTHLGDLAHVAAMLGDILEFMGDES